MKTIIIGNIVSLLGCAVMAYTGLIKEKQKIIKTQCLQFVLFSLGNVILGAITGVVANGVSIVRNILAYYKPLTPALKIFFIVLQIVISMLAGPITLIGSLPIIAGCIFTWFIDLENPVHFKNMIIICQICWIIYDLYYKNFASASFDVFTVVTNSITIVKMRKAGTLEVNSEENGREETEPDKE